MRRLSDYDVVVVQHEYGIFGEGSGRAVLELLAGVSSPVIVTLHTVPAVPSPEQRHILEAIAELAEALVVLSDSARRQLVEGYWVPEPMVHLIPHGASASAVPARVRRVRPRLLTWGLLGPGKGIEWVIDALPHLGDLGLRYRVSGRTHPQVKRTSGEEYRQALATRAQRRGVGDMVRLDDVYLDARSLGRLVSSADVVVVPYDSKDQVSSGVLAEAVAHHRPVVATRFPHAVEMLSGGAGLLVPHRDPAAIAQAVRTLLTTHGVYEGAVEAARRLADELAWSEVAARYQRLARKVAGSSSLGGPG